MSTTAPSDLAVAFRSFPRRLREAHGDLSPSLTARHITDVQVDIAEAAKLLRTGPDPLQIADAIEAVSADAWDEATLDRLRALALQLGGHLRAIAALDPDRD